jgi:hypothetical protein
VLEPASLCGNPNTKLSGRQRRTQTTKQPEAHFPFTARFVNVFPPARMNVASPLGADAITTLAPVTAPAATVTLAVICVPAALTAIPETANALSLYALQVRYLCHDPDWHPGTAKGE